MDDPGLQAYFNSPLLAQLPDRIVKSPGQEDVVADVYGGDASNNQVNTASQDQTASSTTATSAEALVNVPRDELAMSGATMRPRHKSQSGQTLERHWGDQLTRTSQQAPSSVFELTNWGGGGGRYDGLGSFPIYRQLLELLDSIRLTTTHLIP
jgi:hypothetical protein